jgi:hypothetical protein
VVSIFLQLTFLKRYNNVLHGEENKKRKDEMRKNIVRSCCIVSVVLGAVCSGRSSEAMRQRISSHRAAEAVEVALSVVDEVEASQADIVRLASLLVADKVNVSAIFEGDNLFGGLVGKEKKYWPYYYPIYGSNISPIRRVLDVFIEFRKDSRQLSLVRSLFSRLSEDETKTDKESLHVALVFIERLSDLSVTFRSVLMDSIDSGYFDTEFFRNDPRRGYIVWDMVHAITDISPCVFKDDGTPALEDDGTLALKDNGTPILRDDVHVFERDVDEAVRQMRKSYSVTFSLKYSKDEEYSKDVKFFATMKLLCDSNLSLSAAAFLANAAISDPVSAMVFEHFWRRTNKDPKSGYFDMHLPPNDPFLATTTRIAETMLKAEHEASYTDPVTLVSIFENAKRELGLEVEDAASLWISITNSEEVKYYLTISQVMNRFLKNRLDFSEICEITINLLNKNANFDDTRGRLSAMCDPRDFGNLLDQLSQKGIELRDDKVIEECEAERIHSEAEQQELVSLFSLKQLKSLLSPEQLKSLLSPEQLRSLLSPEQLRSLFSPEQLRSLFPPKPWEGYLWEEYL